MFRKENQVYDILKPLGLGRTHVHKGITTTTSLLTRVITVVGRGVHGFRGPALVSRTPTRGVSTSVVGETGRQPTLHRSDRVVPSSTWGGGWYSSWSLLLRCLFYLVLVLLERSRSNILVT